ncbi:MAG: hypothetical protein NUV49_02565 [Patescibacteria group bacterium]|nr:hypothetical protein [Patescibacteria group bacterium]
MAVPKADEFYKEVDSYVGGIPQRRTDFNAGMKTEETGYLDRYRGAIAGQENLPHMYERIGRELGLPQLQQNAGMLRNTLTQIPYTYGEATKGYDVNANQLARIVDTRSSAMTPLVASAEGAVAGAQDQLATRVGFEQTAQQKELLPYEKEQAFMADRFAREASGYSEDMQMTLNSLLAKASAGIELTMQEKELANRLAVAEKQYQAAIQVARINADASRYAVDKNSSRDPMGLFG